MGWDDTIDNFWHDGQWDTQKNPTLCPRCRMGALYSAKLAVLVCFRCWSYAPCTPDSWTDDDARNPLRGALAVDTDVEIVEVEPDPVLDADEPEKDEPEPIPYEVELKKMALPRGLRNLEGVSESPIKASTPTLSAAFRGLEADGLTPRPRPKNPKAREPAYPDSAVEAYSALLRLVAGARGAPYEMSVARLPWETDVLLSATRLCFASGCNVIPTRYQDRYAWRRELTNWASRYFTEDQVRAVDERVRDEGVCLNDVLIHDLNVLVGSLVFQAYVDYVSHPHELRAKRVLKEFEIVSRRLKGR